MQSFISHKEHHTLFENRPKCLIWIFIFGISHEFFVLSKLTCLVTTKSSLARNVIKWDFFCDFQTLWNIRTQSMKITPQSLIWQQLKNSKLKCKKCWGLAIGTSNLLDAFEVKWKTRTSFKAYLEQKDIKNESFISSTYIYVHYVFVCHLVSTNSSHYYWTKKFSNGKHIQGSATHTGAKFEFCPLIKKKKIAAVFALFWSKNLKIQKYSLKLNLWTKIEFVSQCVTVSLRRETNYCISWVKRLRNHLKWHTLLYFT